MLIFPHKTLTKRAKLLRWYGIDRENNKKDFRCEEDIPEWGFKFHMNDICATVGIENLKIVDEVVKTHRENGLYYNDFLFGVDGVTQLADDFEENSSYWIYSMHVERRDDFVKAMADRGIMTSRVHERNDLHSCVSQFRSELPQLEKIVKTMICIPSGWWVNEENRNHIVESIRQGW